MTTRIDMLRKTPLLSAAPDELLVQMAAHTVEKRFTRGDFIFHDGDPSRSLYLITQGEVDIVKITDGNEVLIDHFTAGEPVGEMGLLDDLPRSASARAASDEVVLLELDKTDVLAPLQSQPQVLYETVKVFSMRLRRNSAEIQKRYVALLDANRRLHASYEATLLALSHALDLRDQETEGHSQRVTGYSLVIAKSMHLDDDIREALRLGALLHDIGKIGVSDAILRKPGKLTDEEWLEMRNHPTWGKRIIEDVEFLQRAINVVYSHHERWDGRGYPQGLRGDSIPLGARIFAVADVYDALTTHRPYKRAWLPETARETIVKDAGAAFDPQVVDAFARCFLEIVDVMRRSQAGRLTV